MRRLIRFLVAAVALVGVSATAAEFERVDPQSLGFSSERLERPDALINEKVTAGMFPGADTIFRIYSMTKLVVSVMTMMLVEEGKILLADPVHKYLPESKEMTVATDIAADKTIETKPAKRPMRVHNLLRHSAGHDAGVQPCH